MAHFFDNSPSTGGINKDAEVRSLPSQDYQYALNLRNGAGYQGLEGVSTNVKGNLLIDLYQCPYTGYQGLPTGQNHTIGYFEDVLNNTVVYCNWNSENKHGIYRHYPNKTDANNPLGVVEQVMQFNFNWKQDERITSFELLPSNDGDLFYWTDSWGLREINLDKGNIINKQKSWNIFFPLTNPFKTVASSFELLLEDFNSVPVVAVSIAVATYPNAKDAITFIVDQINANYSDNVTAINRGCYIEISEVHTNSFYYSVGGYPMIISPENWYGNSLKEFMFARAKAPSLYPPICTYKQDLNYSYNNVKNHVFQAAIQFVNDDFSFSVLSVASQLPINNLQCDGTDNQLFNYIDIDFNNAVILASLPEYLTMIKKVKVIVREGNTGVWKIFDEITPCDFLDYVNGAWVLHYGFYNDTQATPVDTVTATQLDSGVAIYADSQNTLFNRVIDGGITLGRTAPVNIEAKVQMEFVDQPNPTLYKVTGKIRVFTYGMCYLQSNGANRDFYTFYPPGLTNGGATNPAVISTYPFFLPSFAIGLPQFNPTAGKVRGGIFNSAPSDTTKYPFFGAGTWNHNIEFKIREFADTDIYGQQMPEAGWPVYCAGTNYLTVSKQIEVGLPTDSVNSIDTSTAQKISNIGTYFATGDDLYSTFELNLPNGSYVVRLGSHWCSFGDKLGKGFPYDLSGGTAFHQTSTNVWGMYREDGTFAPVKEMVITVNNGDVYVGDFIVMDIAPPQDANIDLTGDLWQPIVSYLYDSTANPLGQQNTQMNSATYDGLPVEKTLVNYGYGLSNQDWADTACTDCNGYWFGIAGKNNQQYNNYKIEGFQVGAGAPNVIVNDNPLLWLGTLTDLYKKTLTPLTYDTGNNNNSTYPISLIICCITTDTATARQLSSTVITGSTVDSNGDAVGGVLVVYTNGETTNSSISGVYDLVAWGDMVTPNLGQFPLHTYLIQTTNDRVIDVLVFELSIFCIPEYPNGQFGFPLITPFGSNGTDTPPPYSPTAKYDAGNFIVNEGNDPTQKAWKRGGRKRLVGRGYDDYGRVSSCFFLVDVYTPFITEDLGTYNIEDFTGTVYPAGTFKYGKPTHKWVLNPNTVFPLWMEYFQLMRTKDGIYGRNVQWVANKITYLSSLPNPAASVPEIQTAFQNADAIAIKIDISNMLAYDTSNPGATIGYNYQDGDRVRLIADRSLIDYSTANFPNVGNITDFEIIKDQTSGISGVVYVNPNGFPYELQSGMLFEIFNPHTLETAETELFYEVGEVVKVNNGIPEKYSGIFTNGDTYWRGRLIIVNDNATKFAAAYPVVIEDSSVSDFYKSDSNDINPTRIGTIDTNFREIYYRDRLLVSDVFQEGSALNGLSFCLPTNTTDLGAHFGNVSRLIVIGKLLHAIMKNTNLSSTVGVVSLQYAQSQQTVEAISSDFLGTQYPSRQNIGTDHPATVSTIDGYIYGLFEIRRNVWRHSEDGSVEISRNDYKAEDGEVRTRMMTYFKQLCEGGIWDAVSIFDKRYKEYILTVWKIRTDTGQMVSANADQIQFNTTSPATYTLHEIVELTFINTKTGKTVVLRGTVILINGTTIKISGTFGDIAIAANEPVKIVGKGVGSTIAWNEVSNSWKTEYSFVPECYASLGDNIYSFVDGKMWLHDSNPIRNNFYGQQFTTKIQVVFNDKPDFMKVWNSNILETLQADGNNNWAGVDVTNNNGQQSKLPKGIWRKIREKWFAPFMRNELDLTKPPLARLSQGAPLVSSTLTVLLENDATVEMRLRNWSSNFTFNERTTK